MESVIIQTNFPHRISLSQASQITGYHQDYLGLLCRLGKIEASKIGRNWYTTQTELHKFLNPSVAAESDQFVPEMEDNVVENVTLSLDDILATGKTSSPEQAAQQDAVRAPKISIDSVTPKDTIKRALAPTIVENIVISELESLPIRVVKKPVAAQHHTLQSLITRTKLEQLKQDVLQLSGYMDSVSSELAEHRTILKRHEAMLSARKDLTSAYASNIDFGVNHARNAANQITMIEDSSDTEMKPYRVAWLWPTLAVGVVVLVTIVLLQQALPSPVNYAATIYHRYTHTELKPQVAGESDTPVTNNQSEVR